MARKIYDPNGIEDKEVPEADGMGLFDMTVRWENYDKIVRQNHGTMNIGDHGEIDGYDIHMGITDSNNERPLFTIQSYNGDFGEGSVKESLNLYGTYLHGLFERPAFRRYFMSVMKKGADAGQSAPTKDYKESEDYNLDKLADGFEKHMDMKAFYRILEGIR